MGQRVSWEELDAEIRAGRAASYLDIGDKFNFELKNGEKVSVEVAAVNSYGDNVTFSFTNALKNAAINPTDINRGGFCESEMADILEKEILSFMPDSLAEIITPRKIMQNLSAISSSGKIKKSLKESVNYGCRHTSRFLGIIISIASVMSGIYNSRCLRHVEGD